MSPLKLNSLFYTSHSLASVEKSISTHITTGTDEQHQYGAKCEALTSTSDCGYIHTDRNTEAGDSHTHDNQESL